MKYRLGDLVQIKYGKDHKKLNAGNIPVYGTGGLMRRVNDFIYDGDSVLIPRKGSLNNVMYVTSKFWTVDTIFWTKIDKNKILPKYLYYCLSKIDLSTFNVGSAVPSLTIKILNEITLEVPSLQIQNEIISKIKPIEDKIRLNNKINDNLDALLTNIFKKYMINDDFEKSNLTQIANYKNGLAMQKYRPNSNEESLPVLKIKELNQGNTDDSSDRCSANLDDSVIVNTGDIIFSWSGTLLVKNWTGDKAGLNQHLFKVTSNKYPAWFIYEWTKYHLLRFQAIAAGKATTMGHIKRSDLKSSLVCIPSQLFLAKMDSQLAPIYSQRLNLIKENQQLSKLKQTLLNKYF